MPRSPFVKEKREKAEEQVGAVPSPSGVPDADSNVQIVERVIDLNLINDKLNYLIAGMNKLAEAAEINLKD